MKSILNLLKFPKGTLLNSTLNDCLRTLTPKADLKVEHVVSSMEFSRSELSQNKSVYLEIIKKWNETKKMPTQKDCINTVKKTS